MTSNLTTTFVFGGTNDEIKAMLEEVRPSFVRSKESNYHFGFGISCDFEKYIDELLSKKDDNGYVTIDTVGPFGQVEPNLNLDLFRQMADVAPNGEFRVEITGDITYSSHEAMAELKKGVLTFHSSYYNYDDVTTKISKILIERVHDSDGFKKTFKITSEDEDFQIEDVFDDFVNMIDTAFLEYSDFEDFLEGYDAGSDLSEEDFQELFDEWGLSDMDGIRDEVSIETDYKYDATKHTMI